MGKTYDPELQRQLGEYIVRVGGQGKAAALIGYSATTLSLYRRGVYENGNIEELETKLREIFRLEREAAQLAVSMPDYVPTSISSQVYDTIRICHLKGKVGIERGDPGIGKTKAACKYAQDYPNSAVMLTVNPCFSSMSSFLKHLCLTLQVPTGKQDDMWREVDNYFRGGRKVLIIDEAQHLPIKTIDMIRSFSDKNNDLGICFIGNVEMISGRSDRTRKSYGQINNRVPLPGDRRSLDIKREDIEMLFPMLKEQEKSINLLHAISQSEQGIRGIVNLYSHAHDNENTSYEGLLAAARDMRITTLNLF